MDPIGKYALVFSGGGLGSCLRYWVGALVQSRSSHYPWETMIVNLTGAFVIGAFMAAFLRFDFHPSWRLLLAVGVLGGFTTFSSLCYDALKLLENRNVGAFAGYVVGTNVLGLAACLAGVALARALWGH